MDSVIPQTYSFGTQLVLDNLSTSASTLLEFTRPLRDRVGVWLVAPSTNTAEVSVSLVQCTSAAFAQNAVVDLTPGEKRMFYVKYGQDLHAYSSDASQDLVAYEVVIERVKG